MQSHSSLVPGQFGPPRQYPLVRMYGIPRVGEPEGRDIDGAAVVGAAVGAEVGSDVVGSEVVGAAVGSGVIGEADGALVGGDDGEAVGSQVLCT